MVKGGRAKRDPAPKEDAAPETAGEAAPAGDGVEESDGLVMAETLRGDIRDRILAMIRALEEPFADLAEIDQARVAEDADSLAMRIVYRVIEIIHAEGAPSLRMSVDGVSFKKGVKVSLSGSRNDPNRHLLADATDSDVLIVIENAARFSGERRPPAIDKDAPELPIAPHSDDQHAEEDGE